MPSKPARVSSTRTVIAPKPAEPKAKPATVKPLPPPLKRFLVRCTFVGEDKKKALNGSFRFVAEAADVADVQPKLEKAVKKLRRTTEIPPRCDVYVEFVLELAELERGIVADFERWELEPRRFQHGCIAFSDVCPVYHTERSEPAFRFGKVASEPASAPAPETT